MKRQDKPVSRFIPPTLLDIICLLENDECQASWKLLRNFDSFSLIVKTAVRAKSVNVSVKDIASGSCPVNHKESVGSTDETLTSKPNQKKKKSLSARASDRARRRSFWKRKKSITPASQHQHTEEAAFQTEKESSSPVCNKSLLEDHSASANHLKSDLDTSKTSQVTHKLDQLNANRLIRDMESLEANQSAHELEKESGLVLGSTIEDTTIVKTIRI